MWRRPDMNTPDKELASVFLTAVRDWMDTHGIPDNSTCDDPDAVPGLVLQPAAGGVSDG